MYLYYDQMQIGSAIGKWRSFTVLINSESSLNLWMSVHFHVLPRQNSETDICSKKLSKLSKLKIIKFAGCGPTENILCLQKVKPGLLIVFWTAVRIQNAWEALLFFNCNYFLWIRDRCRPKTSIIFFSINSAIRSILCLKQNWIMFELRLAFQQ